MLINVAVYKSVNSVESFRKCSVNQSRCPVSSLWRRKLRVLFFSRKLDDVERLSIRDSWQTPNIRHPLSTTRECQKHHKVSTVHVIPTIPKYKNSKNTASSIRNALICRMIWRERSLVATVRYYRKEESENFLSNRIVAARMISWPFMNVWMDVRMFRAFNLGQQLKL